MDAKTYALNIISELTGCPMGSLLGELERAHDKDLPLSCQAEGKMWEERVKRTSEKLRDYAAARVTDAVAPYKALEEAARAHDEATYHDERCATRRKLREAIENLDKVLAALPAAGEPKGEEDA